MSTLKRRREETMDSPTKIKSHTSGSEKLNITEVPQENCVNGLVVRCLFQD